MTQHPNHNQTRSMDFRELVRFVLRGATFALAVALLAGATAFLLTRRQSPVYRATASLLATQPGTRYSGDNIVAPPPVDPTVYQSVLLDGPVVSEALTNLEGHAPSPSRMRAFRRDMVVVVDKKDLSSIINIQIEATDPKFAADAANALALSLVSWDRNRARGSLERSISAIHQSMADINQQLQDPNTPADTQRSLQALLQQRTQELRTASASTDSAVFVGLLAPLAMASQPQLAVGPRVVLKTFVAMVTGLFGAYLLLFLRWSLDGRVHGRSDLAELGGTPLLAEFPRRRRRERRLSREAANFLRTNVFSVAGRELPLVVVVSSPQTPSEKEGVALSLAESFARTGYAALLVDADLRVPGTTRALKIDESVSPSLEVRLQNPGRSLPPATVDIGGKRSFDFIPSSKPASYPAELLSGAFGAWLEPWRSSYDVIVVDAPPLLPFADTIDIAAECTGLVLCVSERETTRDRLAAAVGMLRSNHVSFLGSVFTGAPRGRTVAGPQGPGGRKGEDAEAADAYRTQVREPKRTRVGQHR